MSQSCVMREEASLIVNFDAIFPVPPLLRPAVAATPSLHSNSSPTSLPLALMQVGFVASPRMMIFPTTTSEIFFAQAFPVGLYARTPSAVESEGGASERLLRTRSPFDSTSESILNPLQTNSPFSFE